MARGRSLTVAAGYCTIERHGTARHFRFHSPGPVLWRCAPGLCVGSGAGLLLTTRHHHLGGGGGGAQPASDGGCLPQPRWAVCATGAGAHQGQTSREGEKDIWWTARTARGGTGHLGLTETQRGRLWTACGQRCVDSKNSQTTPATTSTSSIRQLLGAADTQTAHHCHIQHSPSTPTTGLRKRVNDTSKSTGRSGRQKAATRCNMRREERVTVQGPVKEQQPDGMSHRGGEGGPTHPTHPPWTPPISKIHQRGQVFFRAFGRSKMFSGAFGANSSKPKIFFGALGASKNSAPPEGGGGGPSDRTARQVVDDLNAEGSGQQQP